MDTTKRAPRILIIDDDPFIADVYVIKFKDEGFEVASAHNGKDGLKKVKEFDPDIILMDVVMPDMDGFQILEELKKETGKPQKIIMLTNLGQKEDVDRGMGLGAMDYMVKAHFTPSEVVEHARKLLARQ